MFVLLSFIWTIDYLEARAKNVKNFFGFGGYEKTRLYAFEIYVLTFRGGS